MPMLKMLPKLQQCFLNVQTPPDAVYPYRYIPTADSRNPLATDCPLTLADVATPVAFFRKHTEFLLGTVGENITHDAPTHPFTAAHESRHESKELCTEFRISIFCPGAATMSVAQSLTKLAPDPVALYVELLTIGHPAVSTTTVEVAGAAEEVTFG